MPAFPLAINLLVRQMMNDQLKNDEIINKAQFPTCFFKPWKLFLHSCLVIFSLLFSACAPAPSKPALAPTALEPTVEAAEEAPEVFTYGQAADELVLRLNAEPSLIGDSLVRLAGVVAGRAVVVEVAGRGRFLKTGSDFCGYLVQAIGQDYVRLEVTAR